MRNYFAGDWTPVGCDEQNPVVASSGKAQMQPVEQGCTLLQLPLQAAKPLVSVLSWRADTVPAHRTAVMIAARNVDLTIFFLMIAPFRFATLSICKRWTMSREFIPLACSEVSPVPGLLRMRLKSR